MASVELDVNGARQVLDVDPLQPLAQVLRDDLGLTGTKLGCEAGDCGACTVLLDGAAVASCLLPVARAADGRVTTIEGLAPPGELHPLQRAFARHNASQCGFCIPGIIMAASELVRRHGRLERDDVVCGLTGNLCRCTGYDAIVDAVLEAHRDLSGAGNG